MEFIYILYGGNEIIGCVTDKQKAIQLVQAKIATGFDELPINVVNNQKVY